MADSIELVLAARYGDLERVSSLLREGADVNSKSTPGKTPIMEACRYAKFEVARELMKYAPDLNDGHSAHMPYSLCWTILNEEEGFARELIDAGALTHGTEGYWYWPVHVVASVRMVPLLEHMVRCGADISARSGARTTPLHHACRHGQLENVKWLVAHGAPLDGLGNVQFKYDAESPLDVAMSWQHPEIISFLRERGAKRGLDMNLPEAVRAKLADFE